MLPPFFIALKYIQSKRYNRLPSLSFLTSFFGVFISVFALISVVSVMEGFKVEFERNIQGLRPHIKVYFLNQYGGIKIFNDYKEKREQITQNQILQNEIKNISGGLSGEAISSNASGSRLSGIILNALEPDGFYAKNLLKDNTSGKFEDEGIVIGSELAFNLGVRLGDEINLISPMFRKTPFGNIPIHKTYKVTGIFNVGMHFYDSSFAFLTTQQGMSFLQKEGAEYLEIMLTNPNNLQNIKAELFKVFNGQNIRITDWKTENKGFIDAINLQKAVMFFILMMFLLLASFIIFSGLSSLVMQKNKTTAILRTMGFSRIQVALTFFTVGSITVLPAIFLGILLGGLFVLNLESLKNYIENLFGTKIFDGAYYFLSYIPSELDLSTILQVSSLSLILCLIAITVPSLKAIRTNPIDALRWE
jgi:lipoprotein-releasing system permease protein